MHIYKLRKLGQRGVGHYVVPVIAFVVLFGAIGSYVLLINSHAATVSNLIKSGYIGMCLSDSNGSNAINVQPALAACKSGTAAQTWQTGFGDGEIHIYGKCLATSGNARVPGASVVVVSCDGSNGALQTSAKWTSLKGGQLQNVNSGLCLTALGSKSGSKTNLQICQNNGVNQNQVWDVDWGSKGSGTGNGGSGSGSGSNSALAAVEWKGVGSTLQNVSTGTCLTVPGGGSAPTTSFTALMLSSCSSATGWSLTWGKTPGTNTTIQAGFGTYCIQTQNGSTSLGTAVGVAKCDGSVAQNWKTGYGSGQIETPSNLSGNNNCLGVSGTKVVTLTCAGASASKEQNL